MRRTLSPYPVPESQYFERILRHDPNSLTQLIAVTSAGLPPVRNLGSKGLGLYTPGALLDAAWVSLARGRDGRPPATSADLRQILDLYLALDDPVTRAPEGMERWTGYLQRTAHHQGPWQEDEYAQLSRSIAVLDQTPYPDDADNPLEVILPGWDHDLLGCSLPDYLGIAHLVSACTTNHPNPHRRGRFALDWYPAEDYDQFDGLRSPAQIKKVLNRHFVTTKTKLRAAFPADHDPLLRRYTHNPLRSRPLVGGVPGGYLIPVPAAVLGKATPLGLYYTGGDNNSKWGKAFVRDVGNLFERYVGRQLDLLPDAEVQPEILVKLSKKESTKTIDFFVVFPRLVLLVEVKSFRPSEPLRLGGPDFTTLLAKQFTKSFDQINRSVRLLRSGKHPELAGIPTDRRMLGMVVTMEPFHQINTPAHRVDLPGTDIPVMVTSIAELEAAVTITGTSLADLLPAAYDTDAVYLSQLFPQYEFLEHNAVLEQGWSAIPFARPRRPRAQDGRGAESGSTG
ncbi:nuclease-related domain-containing protein [Kitasatospora sp. NPDC002965]|uniref:nuclease-related domain-containing protein n=1 Tax=Kitasatospora sp. NPDC002965 TaxID=3154775 RepID=UPI0033B910E0